MRESDRPVDLRMVSTTGPVFSGRGEPYKVQVQVICLEVFQRLVEAFLDVVGVVVCVP